MSKTKLAMIKQGLKYFSSLTPQQKDTTIKAIRIVKNGISELPKGLAVEILKNKPFEDTIKELDFINEKIKGQKMFYYSKLECFLPLNITEILNK